MKQVLLFGAGKSATVLISYLLSQAGSGGWSLTVVDADLEMALQKINQHSAGKAVSFDIRDTELRRFHLQSSDLVISMLPPVLHTVVAKDCVALGKNLLTASYVDDDMKSMAGEIREKGLIFLCEMGLDPGIDHMSAMKIIDQLHARGGKIDSFRSHCGGLVAPESDDNPWHYKVSWNPRNIILAGKAGAHYRENGEDVDLPYQKLFSPHRKVNIPGHGTFSWYPNRDSLSYAGLYGLEDTRTFIRSTLRHPDFMQGWKQIVDMQLTDETPAYDTTGKTLQAAFHEHFRNHGLEGLISSIRESQSAGDQLLSQQLSYLGLDDQTVMPGKSNASAADILQFAVEAKLGLKPGDRDMIVMMHEFGYRLDDHHSDIKSSLVVKGEDSLRTAMAKTVGLPLGIAARLILSNQIRLTGLQIPTAREIYEPVLAELEEYGVRFNETT